MACNELLKKCRFEHQHEFFGIFYLWNWKVENSTKRVHWFSVVKKPCKKVLTALFKKKIAIFSNFSTSALIKNAHQGFRNLETEADVCCAFLGECFNRGGTRLFNKQQNKWVKKLIFSELSFLLVFCFFRASFCVFCGKLKLFGVFSCVYGLGGGFWFL